MKNIRPLSILLFISLLFIGCAVKKEKTVLTTTKAYISPKLNSERIKIKYGNYGVDVLKATSLLRVSNLYSLHKNKKITRTLAFVEYPKQINQVFLKEHSRIINGASIGSTFKQSNWIIKKKHLLFSEIFPSVNYTGLYKLMGGIAPSKLAIHTYKFTIEKEGKTYLYAIISEIHHPDYLSLTALKKNYGNLECFDAVLLAKKNKLIEKEATLIIP
ncbi:hypothetical protein V3A08_01255 [Tenacibaculum maritimum]|uniref:hypothetical protein n=1 Tax=Tenacibaculum maritimum TaxID=107401 RepID=UPI001330660C|nr:hypothetical protein [Tenacibaculum maritimum]